MKNLARFSSCSRERGFTLVELAIVLMIIGLMIGGVLRGQELLENARITSTIAQVQAYFGARHTFADTYGSAPGDMPNALQRLPNCTAANSCFNGNGDGDIGTPIMNNTININQAGSNALPQVETTMFWKHMAMAKLISGVTLDADTTRPEWGRTHPTAKIAGGFSIFTMRDQGSSVVGDKGIGYNLRLQSSPISDGISDPSFILTPRQALRLDLKMDDGNGDRGFVTADHEWDCDGNDGVYLRSDNVTCVVYFRMN